MSSRTPSSSIRMATRSSSRRSRASRLVVDFIYTTCPGPCLMETAKFANVALRLGNDLGSKVTLVSITVDPEHDGPNSCSLTRISRARMRRDGIS